MFEDARNRWQRALSANSPDADGWLEQALTAFSNTNYLTPLAGSMTALPDTPAQLAARGDAFAKGDRRHIAVIFWNIALQKLGSGRAGWTDKPLDNKQRESIERELKAKIAAGWT